MTTATKKTAKPADAISTRMPAVEVEYDARGKRVTKHFADANEAKRFFAAKDKAGKNPKVIGQDEAAAADDKPDDKPAKTKMPKAAKPEATQDAAPKPEAKPKPKPAGVAFAKTRPYVAGLILRRHGLAAGVTPAMIAEVDAEYGDANPRESSFCLRNAWHAARAYSGELADV